MADLPTYRSQFVPLSQRIARAKLELRQRVRDIAALRVLSYDEIREITSAAVDEIQRGGYWPPAAPASDQTQGGGERG